jgi:hypothetical protein
LSGLRLVASAAALDAAEQFSRFTLSLLGTIVLDCCLFKT